MASQALERAARAQGFSSFAQYQAYQAQQAMMRERANVVGQGTVGQAPQQPKPAVNAPPQNWLQRLMWGLSGGR